MLLLICRASGQDVAETPLDSKDQQEKQEKQPTATVIVIDDDEAEFVDVADMSCQATFEEIEHETRNNEKEKEKTLEKSQNGSSPPKQQIEQRDILQKYVPIRPAPVKDSIHTCNSGTLQTATSSVPQQTISKQTEVVVSSVSSVAKTPPVIYRTLKSPVESGAPFLPQRVALKSSPPSLPVQQAISKSPSGTASSLVSPGDNRYVFISTEVYKASYMYMLEDLHD